MDLDPLYSANRECSRIPKNKAVGSTDKPDQPKEMKPQVAKRKKPSRKEKSGSDAKTKGKAARCSSGEGRGDQG
ncbi:unnamed protein product [Echinostoma caproni]|uniref:BLVR domain-containing protein n=1 Tax=Echinostoma caproni TaxID=27848 RepID=A0A183ACN5_9TREM|nr:unnamed protein product [Echinostoma caproni]